MMRLFRYFKSHVIGFVFAILAVATISYALQSVTIKQHPDATDSVKVVGQKLLAIDSGFLHAVMAGEIANHIYIRVNGHSHAVGTADQELSALNTVGFGNWPSTGGVVSVVSDDVDDDGDPADTGARTLIIRGLLTSDWSLDTETITLNGTTPVVSTKSFIRINELEVVTAGTTLTNEGTITASIGGTDIMEIYPEHTTSDAGRFTIPAGYEGHFQNIEGSSRGNKALTYHIFCRDTTVADAPFQLRASWHSLDGGFRPNGLLPIFTEKVDVIFIVHAELAGAATSGSFEGWIEATN